MNEMKGAVTAAQKAADGAAKTAKDADKAVSNAVATKVTVHVRRECVCDMRV